MFEAAYTITEKKNRVHVAIVTKVCICSHSSFRSGGDYSTRLFAYSSYRVLLVLRLLGSILLSLSSGNPMSSVYIATLPVFARLAQQYFLDMLGIKAAA